MTTETPTIEAARAVKDEAKRLLSKHGDVVGVGLTRRGNGYAVKINLQSEPRGGNPPCELHGVPLVIEVVGRIRKRRG